MGAGALIWIKARRATAGRQLQRLAEFCGFVK
jgi:hypothetical protein